MTTLKEEEEAGRSRGQVKQKAHTYHTYVISCP
jgi:hypothetical protein